MSANQSSPSTQSSLSMQDRGGIALALNFGSTSLKAASYAVSANAETGHAVPQLLERMSIESTHGSSEGDFQKILDELIRRFSRLHTPTIVAHRIVHGADRPGPMELTPETLAELQALSPLAPMHQPPALALAKAAIQRWPNARQMGVFDTSWHQTMPERHRIFPIPYSLYSTGVKRFGFHGLAFQSAMRQLGRHAPELAAARIVLAHLGGGSSVCAVVNGSSVNTTMGMTPLGGVAMSSRSGSLDPGVLLYLQRSLHLSSDEIDHLLWRNSGLKGISGESGDMRKLLASGTEGARRAIDAYVCSLVQGIAAMAASIGGIDALVFSGGVGANAAQIREQVAGELAWLGVGVDAEANQAHALDISSREARVKSHVLHTDEETEMINEVVIANRSH